MKYIRFGDTIREVKFEDENVFAYYSSSKDDFYLANKKDVSKTADDLFDLLDKVVIITTYLPNLIFHDIWINKRAAFEVFVEEQRRDRDFSSMTSCRCMGAVWTDDGLRYVAEYKDGEWELL